LRILYIATSFPEPAKGDTIYTDLAEALHVAEHEITVAVSEQTRNRRTAVLCRERDLDVLRIVTGNYYDVGLIEKGITTLRIPIAMRRGIIKFLGKHIFDMILFESPPVTNVSLVSWAKKQFKCPAYLMLKDIFPQNAVDLGVIKKGGILYAYFCHKEKKLYRTADFIGCMSDANRKYLLDHNCWLNPDKVELFPNTKKLTNDIVTKEFPLRKKFGIPETACVFLFGGNMGRPQCIDLLCETITTCKDDGDIFFLFVGRGTDRYKIENTIAKYNIKNSLLIDAMPRPEFEQIIRECDVGLIVLDPRFTIPNYPSRILSYMEYAKPVLAITDMVSDISELINAAQCGEWVWSGDKEGIIRKVREMAQIDKRSLMGLNARNYIENHFEVKSSVHKLEQAMKRRKQYV